MATALHVASEVQAPVEAPAVVPVSEMPKVSLDILATVRQSQAGNGVRHGDYLRYRRYCARRLRRMRVSKDIRILHGKGRAFVKKEITPEIVEHSR